VPLPAVIAICFVAVILLLLAAYLGTSTLRDSPKAELRRRLRRMAKGSGGGSLPQDLRSEILRETPRFERIIGKIPLLAHIEKKLDNAGLKITVSRFLLIAGIAAVAGFFLGFLVSMRWEAGIWVNLLVAVLVSAIFVSSLFIYLEILKRKRYEKFTELFPDALTMISRSLRAGHSFTSAIELVGAEVSDPVGSLFKTAYDQQLLGLRINESLNNMNERMDSIDLRFFTMAVGINSEVGGNLAEILDKLAATIRERIRIKRQVRVFTAQARMSGYVLAVLPIVTFILLNIIHPGYEEPMLKERFGIYVLVFAGVMQFFGFLVIRKIINIRI
jgi:tight adherence protein B